MNEKELIEQLKVQLIEQLNLEDLETSDIGDDMMLFGEELGLDSIDALEIIVLLEKEYGVKIENQSEGQKVFKSIRSIAQFVAENQMA